MPLPRALAAIAAAVLSLSACDSAGGHNETDEGDQQNTEADSLSAGTDVPATVPPQGTVNPAAPSGPGIVPDSPGGGAAADSV